tara:strand:+ start:1035 stop:1931 length:897 start_codon:yes stop_codon:yes gene_type:complete
MSPIYVGNRKILGTQSSDPTGFGASDEGSVYYNSTDDKLKVWDGTAWDDVGAIALGTQLNPAYSGKHLKDNGVTNSGNYYIKPNGYTGNAIECYVDMDVAGGGWVLCGAFASESNFEMRLHTAGKDASNVKNYPTTAPSSSMGGPKLLPKDFCNKLFHQSNSSTDTTYTDYQMLTVCGRSVGGTIVVEYRAKSSNRTSSHDAWRLVYASGSMNNQWDSRHVADSGQNSSTWWQTQTSLSNPWVTFNSGRAGSDGANNYHYIPDDYTGGSEWLFRENIDDTCSESISASSNVPCIFFMR